MNDLDKPIKVKADPKPEDVAPRIVLPRTRILIHRIKHKLGA